MMVSTVLFTICVFCLVLVVAALAGIDARPPADPWVPVFTIGLLGAPVAFLLGFGFWVLGF